MIKTPPVVQKRGLLTQTSSTNNVTIPLQHNSLPRKKSDYYRQQQQQQFQRNTPMRRSGTAASTNATAEQLIEYFVPRSVSEFNLTGITDKTFNCGVLLPPATSSRLNNRMQTAPGSGQCNSSKLIANNGMQSTKEKSCGTSTKMVTFEDEQLNSSGVVGGGGNVRKNVTIVEDVFM